MTRDKPALVRVETRVPGVGGRLFVQVEWMTSEEKQARETRRVEDDRRTAEKRAAEQQKRMSGRPHQEWLRQQEDAHKWFNDPAAQLAYCEEMDARMQQFLRTARARAGGDIGPHDECGRMIPKWSLIEAHGGPAAARRRFLGG